jgi:hypothetical protein
MIQYRGKIMVIGIEVEGSEAVDFVFYQRQKRDRAMGF